MKRKSFTILICALLIATVGMTLVSCNRITADLLGEPQKAVALSYNERSDSDFVAFMKKTEAFAAKFAASAYESSAADENFAVSPLSVFMALSLAAECANGDTRAELLSALGTSYEELYKNFPILYRSIFANADGDENTVSPIQPTNSIWIDKSAQFNQDCVNRLADKYFAYSYSAQFTDRNNEANKAVRQFVKDKTRGLIDKDFGISDQTLFAIINTLYLKTAWNYMGEDLPFTENEYTFTAKDGSTTQKRLLSGYYKNGRAYETDTYSTFLTEAHGGFKIKFILPKSGYSVDDVFTAENIATVNAISDYNGYDSGTNTVYKTRCLFPEYKCGYDGDLKKILEEKFGIRRFFRDPVQYADGCDLSTLTSDKCFCTKLQHVIDLNVNKKGIEGAAATVIGLGDTGPQPAEIIKLDFVLDRAFGFIITDAQGLTLFSGVVDSIA